MLCIDCNNKKFCSSPCAALNKYLKDNGIYSADWIRPKRAGHKKDDGKGSFREIPFSALNREDRKSILKKYGDLNEI